MPPGRRRWRAIGVPGRPAASKPSACVQAHRPLFLRDKRFHGAKGFEITDEVVLAIAAQAVLPVLHLRGGLTWYDDFVGIVVHATEVVARRRVTDPAQVVHEYDEVIAGEAMENGPVTLSWKAVQDSGNTAGTGYNVVIHEFAHKIDMRDGALDGCPAPARRLQAGARSASAARRLARGAEARLRGLPRKDNPRRTLRRRAAVARWLRRRLHRRILRGGVRSLLREPQTLRRGLRRRCSALFDAFFKPGRALISDFAAPGSACRAGTCRSCPRARSRHRCVRRPCRATAAAMPSRSTRRSPG